MYKRQAFVTYFVDGSRKFIFHFAHSAAGKLSPKDIDEVYLEQAEYLHVMGCSLSASESMREAIWKAVQVVKKKGVKISFDPNLRPELLDDRRMKQIFESILAITDIFLTGESEILTLTGRENSDLAVEEMQKKGISVIVLKNGAKGVKVYSEGTTILIPPFKVEEVDSTGAGDCFDGAFIACLAEGRNMQEAALFANAAGAMSVTQKGPMEGTSLKVEIEEYLKMNVGDRP